MATASNPPVTPREAGSSTAAVSGPNEDEIRRRAYQRYLERGGGDGQDFDDWLEAERELRNRQSLKSEVSGLKSQV